jgi:prepilin-type N-terminal cleavage/methylation domain-containing protein
MDKTRTMRRGFTLVEAMVLMVILSIVAVAAGVGLQAVAKVPTAVDQKMAINNAVVDYLEQWKAKSWATMNPSAPANYSVTDTVTVNGKSYSRTVLVENADPASPESGGTASLDFRRITVTVDATTMRCYVTKP